MDARGSVGRGTGGDAGKAARSFGTVSGIASSTPFVWSVLALPAVFFVYLLARGAPVDGKPVMEALLHPTGETSARLLIITIAISPLRLLFPGSRFWRWMGRHRRWFGVASFAYAAFHTVLYVVERGTVTPMLAELGEAGIWTGWLAFAIFVPLAITSNDAAMRVLRANWKRLQRLTYAAAVLTLAHWVFVHFEVAPALVHFVPLAGLELYRWNRTRGARPGNAHANEGPANVTEGRVHET